VQCWWATEFFPGRATEAQSGPLRDEANRLYARLLEARACCCELSLAPLLPFLGFAPQAAGLFQQRLVEFVPPIQEDPDPFENAQSLNWSYDMETTFRNPLVALRQRIVSRLTGARVFEVRRGKPSAATVVLIPDGEYFVSEDVGVFLDEVF